MRVTSLKELDSYIYSTVILPLKELDVDGLNVSSPMIDDRGRQAELYVGREETTHRRYDHNFQRNEARDSAKWLVWLKYNNMRMIVADYDRFRHGVNVYDPVFLNVPRGKFLMNKLVQAFGNYTPFTKVEIKNTIRDQYQSGAVSASAISDDEDEEDYDD